MAGVGKGIFSLEGAFSVPSRLHCLVMEFYFKLCNLLLTTLHI